MLLFFMIWGNAERIMSKLKFYSVLASILLLTVFIYWAGLKGDYVFDDSANILENSKVAITNLDYNSLKAAYGSGDAGPLGRPVSMLSFALNHYFTGFDPFYFKLTNLFIHLLNGVLICFLSLSILNWINKDKKLSDNKIYILALLITAIWLIHPLNLTSVLYIVQRMTSLSTLFGLLALVLYFKWRVASYSVIKNIVLLVGIIVSFILSALSKESGLLFIILLYWIELLIFQAKNKNGIALKVFNIKLHQLLWISAVLGGLVLLYLIQPHFNPSAFVRREFGLIERLLTESRVIFFYIKMFVYPQLNELSLYHDDFVISKSLLNPITTLYSVVGLVLISIGSVVLAKRYPLVLFAWGWFLISHLMESTAFSLELVHEHRNYFAFIGIIIVVLYYLAQLNSQKLKPFIYLLGLLFILNLAFTTWQRSVIWSNLVDHAVYEATMYPKSDRANYQLARIYIKLMENEKNESLKKYYIQQVKYYLEASKNSYLPANGAWFAEIHLNSYLNKPISVKTVNQLINQLENKPFQNSNVSFLSAFANCQIKSFCKLDHMQAVQIIAAGLDNKTSNPDINSEIYKLLAQYYVSVLGDYVKSEEFLAKAITLKNDVNGHLLLTQVYRLQGKINEANEQLQVAVSLDHDGVWFKEINIEKRNLNDAANLGK